MSVKVKILSCGAGQQSTAENGKKGKMIRHCTIDYKIVQMQNFVRWNLLGYKKYEKLKGCEVGTHEMHIGFTAEERQRIFESKHRLFVNKFPMAEMGLTRADNYAYVKENWGLETRGSACLFCPFHTNFFFDECKKACPSDYSAILAVDDLLEMAIPNRRIGVPYNQVFISRSRKRIRDLKEYDCQDQQTFPYKNMQIWNGL